MHVNYICVVSLLVTQTTGSGCSLEPSFRLCSIHLDLLIDVYPAQSSVCVGDRWTREDGLFAGLTAGRGRAGGGLAAGRGGPGGVREGVWRGVGGGRGG